MAAGSQGCTSAGGVGRDRIRSAVLVWAVALVLSAAALLIGSAPTRAVSTQASPIPEGSSVWFACTQRSYHGPDELDCPKPYDPRYASALLQDFDRMTPENEFKMVFLEPSPDRFDFTLADQVAAFARDNGKTIRGHTLIWGHELPLWVTTPILRWNRAALSKVLQSYISTVVGHFATHFPGVVTEWDVVNEPFGPTGALEPNPWSARIGPDYIAMALEAAHRADPHARLVINDYSADTPGPKAEALLALATQLKRSGVPLDAIGFQAHVTPDTAPTLDDLVSIWRRYAAAGLDVEVTELDVGNDFGVDDPIAKQDVFRRYALACRIVGNCTGLTVWGVADSYSWRGANTDALLYDSNFVAKPAAGIVRAILSGTAAAVTAPRQPARERAKPGAARSKRSPHHEPGRPHHARRHRSPARRRGR